MNTIGSVDNTRALSTLSTGRIDDTPASSTPSPEPMKVAARPNAKVPYDPGAQLDAVRRWELQAFARSLVGEFGTTSARLETPEGPVTPLPKLGYDDIGKVVNRIAADPRLSEKEKAYAWNQFASHRSFEGDEQVTDWYEVTLDGANPKVIDTFRDYDSPRHAVVSLDDRYVSKWAHTPSLRDAEGLIRKAEENEGGPLGRFGRWVFSLFGKGPINEGDVHSTLGAVAAFQAWERDGFSAFAQTWNQHFVKPN